MEILAQGNKQSPNNVALTIALCVFVAMMGVSLFRWTLVEYVTPFVEPLIEGALGIVFLASLIWSTLHLLKAKRKAIRTALLPLLVNITTFLIVLFVPFTKLTIEIDFHTHYNARSDVVRNVLAGNYENQIKFKGGRGDLIALPAKLSYLSSGGGDILRCQHPNGTLIFFFSYRGILSSFSGFVYSSDDTPPSDEDFGGNFVEIERLRKNWFWAASSKLALLLAITLPTPSSDVYLSYRSFRTIAARPRMDSGHDVKEG